MKAIREDAERALRLCKTTFSVALTRQQTQLLGSLAAFVRNITDETPLTVEALVREGFTHKSRPLLPADEYRCGPILWTFYENGVKCLEVEKVDLPKSMYPRTVGELRWLLYQLKVERIENV